MRPSAALLVPLLIAAGCAGTQRLEVELDADVKALVAELGVARAIDYGAAHGGGGGSGGTDLTGLGTDGAVAVWSGTDTVGAGSADQLDLAERSSDPSAPSEGQGKLWISDGTGSGDDGDLIWRRQAGSTTREVAFGLRGDGRFEIGDPAGTNESWVVLRGGNLGGEVRLQSNGVLHVDDGTQAAQMILGDVDGEVVFRHTTGVTTGIVSVEDSGNNHPLQRVDPTIAGGRLTLTDDTPVTTSDVTDANTLYYESYASDQVAVYDGTAVWSLLDLGSGISIANTSLSNDTNYDVFVFDSSGATLELVAWTNDTTRATALVRTDGVWTKSGDTTRRYLGTVRTDAAGADFEDSEAKRFVWNVANRVKRADYKSETVDSWTESGNGTWSSMAAAGTTGVWQREFVRGLDEDAVTAQTLVNITNRGTGGHIHAIALDWSSGAPTRADAPWGRGFGSADPTGACFGGLLGIGHRTLTAIETTTTADTQTVRGDAGGGNLQSGMVATTWQ